MLLLRLRLMDWVRAAQVLFEKFHICRDFTPQHNPHHAGEGLTVSNSFGGAFVEKLALTWVNKSHPAV